MDKTGIIVVSLCVVLLGWWFVEQNKIAGQQAEYARTHPVAVATNTPATAPTNATATTNGAAPVIQPAVTVTFNPATPEQMLVLTNGRARYTFTTRGGGLKQVDLLDYPETISVRWKGQITNSASIAGLNAHVEMPVLAVLGGDSLVGDGNFTVTPTATGVRAEKNLPGGLRLVKNFQFGSNFLIHASVRLENNSSQSVALPALEIVAGTATPMDADDSNFSTYGGAMWSDGVTALNEPLASFSGGGCSRTAPKSLLLAGGGNVLWAAAHNQFFALMLMTKTNEPAQQMIARTVTLPRFQNVGVVTNSPAPEGLQTALLYPPATLTANSAMEKNFILFAGPKEFRVLSGVAAQFGNRADEVMNFGTGFATFWGVGTFFAKLLLSAMNGVHDLTRLGYGWTIVIITVLIKLLFWLLTAASTRSMKRMQALAPEINALKEKYKDDQQKQMAKTWELYKQHKVNPMSGCWPMLIQMPVFIGFFTMIRSAIELRGAGFLWAADLSKPDTLFMIPGITFIPLISDPVYGLPFNLLPLLMGGAMLWQSHLTPASPGMDPAQQKMMRWLPAMFIVFLYNYSSGLALYWTVNNLLTILQTKLTKNIKPLMPAAPLTNPALTPVSKKKK